MNSKEIVTKMTLSSLSRVSAVSQPCCSSSSSLSTITFCVLTSSRNVHVSQNVWLVLDHFVFFLWPKTRLAAPFLVSKKQPFISFDDALLHHFSFWKETTNSHNKEEDEEVSHKIAVFSSSWWWWQSKEVLTRISCPLLRLQDHWSEISKGEEVFSQQRTTSWSLPARTSTSFSSDVSLFPWESILSRLLSYHYFLPLSSLKCRLRILKEEDAAKNWEEQPGQVKGGRRWRSIIQWKDLTNREFDVSHGKKGWFRVSLLFPCLSNYVVSVSVHFPALVTMLLSSCVPAVFVLKLLSERIPVHDYNDPHD